MINIKGKKAGKVVAKGFYIMSLVLIAMGTKYLE